MLVKKFVLALGLFSCLYGSVSVVAEESVVTDSKSSIEIKQFDDVKPAGLEKETPAILDSDQDGVTLDIDQCRSTPLNVAVDEKGCAIDRCPSKIITQQSIEDGCHSCPEGSLLDEKGCYELIKDKKVYPLNVKFTSNSSEVRNQYLDEINRLTRLFINIDSPLVIIEGHTDSLGRDEFNRKLSQNRANSVADAMINFGIDKNRIKAIGFGETQAIADNTTELGREENRRVNAVVKTEEEIKVYIIEF